MGLGQKKKLLSNTIPTFQLGEQRAISLYLSSNFDRPGRLLLGDVDKVGMATHHIWSAGMCFFPKINLAFFCKWFVKLINNQISHDTQSSHIPQLVRKRERNKRTEERQEAVVALGGKSQKLKAYWNAFPLSFDNCINTCFWKR